MKHANQLAAKVFARNRINGEANRLAPICLESFRPFLGKKILNVTGCACAKAYAVAPKSDERDGRFTGFERHLRACPYSLRLEIRCCEDYPANYHDTTCTTYAEQSVSIGEIKDGILTKLFDPPCTDQRTDYTTAEVEAARAELKAAQHALDEARSKICQFGEYDN